MRQIDADALKEWVENWVVKNKYYHPYSKSNSIPIPELHDILERIPTVEPIKHGQWIPCSERLPDKEGSYLCTVGSDYRNPREMIYAPNNFMGNENTWKCPDGYYVFNWFVIAWMPMPKPFKENEVER